MFLVDIFSQGTAYIPLFLLILITPFCVFQDNGGKLARRPAAVMPMSPERQRKTSRPGHLRTEENPKACQNFTQL